MSRVERTELAPGLEISRVLTGLWQIADMEKDGTVVDAAEAARSMVPYVEAGLTTFDMADHYGSAEEIVGVYATEVGSRGDVQLFTKWVPDPGPVSRSDVRGAVQRALDRMRTDALDLLQFHAWAYWDPRWLDTLFWLQELKAEGLIRHLGVTNFDAAHLNLALHSGIELASNQVCYSLVDQRPAGGLTQVCEEHGVKLLCYGTVAGGLLTEQWLGANEPAVEELATWSRRKYFRFVEAAGGWEAFQGVLRAVKSVAERRDVSMANVASRYILDRPAVAGVIIGARLGESRHLEDNLRLFDLELTEEDRSEIAQALLELGTPPGDSGDEYRRPPYLTAAGDLSDHFQDFPAPYPVEGGPGGRELALTGTVWEELAGFARAVRTGSRILVSGTTATHAGRVVGGDDAAAQAAFCLDKIQGAVRSLGGRLEDVVRTRVYLRHADDWEPVSRVHGRYFGEIRPANTLLQAGIVGEEYLVEVEAEAVVSGFRSR